MSRILHYSLLQIKPAQLNKTICFISLFVQTLFIRKLGKNDHNLKSQNKYFTTEIRLQYCSACYIGIIVIS